MKYDSTFSRKGILSIFGRLDRINRKLKRELMLSFSDVVLDIGCDKGDLVSFLRPFCKKIIGIDINKEVIERSKNKDLMVMDARKTNFSDNYFTKIVSSMTIEHIPDLKKTFEEIDRIIKPQGLVVLHYPWELFRGMGQ